MIKSVAGNYKGVVSITCIVNIDADILYQVWLNVVKLSPSYNLTQVQRKIVQRKTLWWIYEDVDTESVVPR